MILGAAAAQVPIIQRVHGYGFRSVVVSSPGNHPGFAVADEYHEIDIRDEARVLAVARTHSICGILTDQTDVGVPTVARVADELGLPGIGHHCAVRFVNKFLMREAAERIGIPVPRAARVRSGAAPARAGWPQATLLDLHECVRPEVLPMSHERNESARCVAMCGDAAAKLHAYQYS